MQNLLCLFTYDNYFLVYFHVLSTQILRINLVNQVKTKPSDTISVKVYVFSIPGIVKSLHIFDGV